MATLGLRIYQKVDVDAQFSVLLENKKLKTSLLFQAGTVAELSKLKNLTSYAVTFFLTYNMNFCLVGQITICFVAIYMM